MGRGRVLSERREGEAEAKKVEKRLCSARGMGDCLTAKSVVKRCVWRQVVLEGSHWQVVRWQRWTRRRREGRAGFEVSEDKVSEDNNTRDSPRTREKGLLRC